MEKRNRSVFISGGATGIGRAAAEAFADAGYNVAFCYNKSEREARELFDALTGRGINALCRRCDVSDAAAVGDTYDFFASHFGFIDTVVANAAVAKKGLFCDEDAASFDALVAVNQKGVFNVCRAFIPAMIRERFGRVITVSSAFGISGASCESLYAMTKAAVIGLTKSLSLELAPSGITANVIAPGLIDTKMNAALTPAELGDLVAAIPASRIGVPADVAAAALFLASENAGYITGHVLSVNGGIL
ncbi:MAG: SDR family oxidoreductase [Clostridiales bacterium]|jgi:3-oxoacyl-[acyl-carrier protein] reductase|nr:SDR family oxidoreductase [Clostridiales bacterium]